MMSDRELETMNDDASTRSAESEPEEIVSSSQLREEISWLELETTVLPRMKTDATVVTGRPSSARFWAFR